MRVYGDPEPGDIDALAWAKEVMLDAMLYLVHDKGDDELVFVDAALRSMGEALGIAAAFVVDEPMTAGEFRRRHRAAKAALANGESDG